jgi:hypothetical protein
MFAVIGSAEVYRLYTKTYLVKDIKINRVLWAGHVIGMNDEIQEVYS